MNEHRFAHRRRRGFTWIRVVVGVGTLLAAMPVTSARADTVVVGFGVGGFVSTAPACQVAVPLGANGFSVLDAAVAKGCIQSYETTGRWDGHRGYAVVKCLNGVCEQRRTVYGPCDIWQTVSVGWWHAFHRADLSYEYGPGLGDFYATNGKSIAMTYGVWPYIPYVGPIAPPRTSPAAPRGGTAC